MMQLALGMEPASECQEPAEVQRICAEYQPLDYARCGATATTTITLPRGTDALAKLPHSIEAHLRSLGLPTQLVDGRIHLLGDHTVCKEGKELSADAAQVLKLLEIKQAQFTMTVEAHWHRDGGKVVDCS